MLVGGGALQKGWHAHALQGVVKSPSCLNTRPQFVFKSSFPVAHGANLFACLCVTGGFPGVAEAGVAASGLCDHTSRSTEAQSSRGWHNS